MRQSFFYYKELTPAEAGETGTHEIYVRLPNNFDYETFFGNDAVKNGTVWEINFTAHNITDGGDESIALRFVYFQNSNKEKRIPSLGPLFRKHNIQSGDIVSLESRIDGASRSYFICFYKKGEIQISPSSIYFSQSARIESKILESSDEQPLQQIFYGPPGTGKSYNIDKELKDKNIPDTQVKRVIFYPDYTYTDFIGGLLPVTDEGEKPKYKFVAGPFTEILKDAFENSDKSYYIVIEEINRGNPAAIFGDIFQLLDRDSSGKSKYTITNKDICSYLRGGGNNFANDRLWIPSNLNIICTMNTADQNVFVLDTAFKRRFKMEYVPIDFKKLQDSELLKYNEETEVFAGNKSLKEIFENTDLGTYVSKHEAEMKRNWPTFAKLVNEKINIINSSGDSISEDKKLGPFFISIDELADKRKFADKVLYYLKQDVFKYTDSVLTPSYQKLYDDFVNGDDDIFELFATAK